MRQKNRGLHFFLLLFLLLQTTILNVAYAREEKAFSLLNYQHYKKMVALTRDKISTILVELKPYRQQELEAQIAWITTKLSDIPYLYADAMGEGDWQADSKTYQPGAMHINQNPVYRLDGLNCQTLVQNVLALLISTNINEFDNHILKIAYGAARQSQGDVVRYYNRNHFIDADFNLINQKNGLLMDASTNKNLLPYSKKMVIQLNRQQWFLNQQKNLADTVKVFSKETGKYGVKRFTHFYSHLPFPQFDKQIISLRYIPKEYLVIKKKEAFIPNQPLLNQIPTPAIAEVVRDVKQWHYTISHLGLLYKQTFKKGDVIYQKINCYYDKKSKKKCRVRPILCQQNHCHELMFTHATNAYPTSFYWYQNKKGDFLCTSDVPPKYTPYTSCNRVMSSPFFDYLTDYQFGYYLMMDVPSIIGIHFERITITS